MRIELSQLSTTEARITLPPQGGEDGLVHIAETLNLKGVLDQSADTIRIENCSADAIRFHEAKIRFGSVGLGVEKGALLKRVQAQLTMAAGALRAEVDAEHLQLDMLTVRTGSVRVTAQIMARDLKLSLDEGLGTLRASYLELTDFTLEIGTTTVRAPHLVAQDVTIEWGGPSGFALLAAAARASDLELVLSGTTVRARALSCTELSYKSSVFSLAMAEAERLEADASLTPSAPEEHDQGDTPHAAETSPAPKTQAKAPLVDLQLLDGLQGHVNVDLGVHMLLAVLPRHAIHRLRLHIADGTLNFREVEDGLARLEDSLLDFSRRDAELVLELGIPFLHTRGHGKTLVRWPLTPNDITLADDDRVRLSVLAQPVKAEPDADESTEDDQKRGHGAFRVRGVDADEIDVALSLTPVQRTQESVLRSLGFESLRVVGDVHVRPEGGDAEGHVELDIAALSAALAALPVGASSLSLGALNVPGLLQAKATFAGAKPREIHAETGAFTLHALRLG